MNVTIEIKKDIILWALSRAGHEKEDIIFSPQIKFWLSGQKKPTIKQLAYFSREVHLPLIEKFF